MKTEIRFGANIKYIAMPVIIGAALIAAGILLGDAALLGNMIFIAMFISSVPYFLYRYSRFLYIKSIENQFPNFVRDLADSIRSGMSFPEAIRITTKSNYGKLSGEIERMNNRLSWGTPLLRVLEIFGNDVRDSKMITEALRIIRQSYESGGETASTLSSISEDLILLKEAEAERSSIVRQHVIIMYGIFYLFLGVALLIIIIMVPIIENQALPAPTTSTSLGGFTFANPCEGVSYFPCDYFGAVAAIFDAGESIGGYYISLFFTIVLVQGLFTGLIAGQLGQSSIVAGAKHSLLMVFSSIGIFLFLAKIGMLPI